MLCCCVTESKRRERAVVGELFLRVIRWVLLLYLPACSQQIVELMQLCNPYKEDFFQTLISFWLHLYRWFSHSNSTTPASCRTLTPMWMNVSSTQVRHDLIFPRKKKIFCKMHFEYTKVGKTSILMLNYEWLKYFLTKKTRNIEITFHCDHRQSYW